MPADFRQETVRMSPKQRAPQRRVTAPGSPLAGRPGRTVRESAAEMAQLVLPHEANVHGTVLGGTVMHWIDLAAAVVATRHCRRPVVTAAIDEMSFRFPIQVGQLALLHARMTLVDTSSMEIRVDVDSEDLMSGERQHTSTAFVTFVALDPVTRRPTAVPPLVLANDDEREEHKRARERRRLRLARRAATAVRAIPRAG
jgi:acyl-CoA hydrolase